MSTTSLSRKVDDLLDSGMAYKVIASFAKCDYSTIYRIKTGEIDDPRYSVGSAIDELHAGLRKKSAVRKTAA
ncbi:hypothetical protein D3C81_2122510 [compost metagenome]